MKTFLAIFIGTEAALDRAGAQKFERPSPVAASHPKVSDNACCVNQPIKPATGELGQDAMS